MLIKKPDDIKSSEITDYSDFKQRRRFIKQAALLGIGTGLGAMALQSGADTEVRVDNKISPLLKTPYGDGLDKTPYKHVTGYNNFYEFGTSKSDPAEYASSLKTRPWSIMVDGECEAPGEIGIEEILSGFTQEERIYRFRCVEAWSMVVPWVGFSLGDLLKRFKPTSRAKYVMFETLHDPIQMPEQTRDILDWPYTEGLRMDEAMHPLTLLSTGLYGEELPNQNGAPVRLVVPWKYGFKSIKSIVKIRFMEVLPETTWWKMAPSEYGFYANVNPNVDHPRWSQKYHRNLGESVFAKKQKTLMFNGYAEEVASLYKGMDLSELF